MLDENGPAAGRAARAETFVNNTNVSTDSPSYAARQPPQLRPYQVDGLDVIRNCFRRGARRVLYVLPTGAGKTICFSFLAAEAARRGKRIVILVHRQELVGQTLRALATIGVPHGVIAAGYTPAADARVQVASVMTLVRRLDRDRRFDLVVIDEAHHAVAGSWGRILEEFRHAFVLGVTATPARLDGLGLGDVFDELVIGPSVKELVELGFLAPAVTYAPPEAPDLSGIRTRGGDYVQEELAPRMSNSALVGNAVEHYGRLCPGAPGLVYCVGIEHSELVAQRFQAAGFRAQHVDGETPKGDRRAAITALAAGELDLLTNCGLFSEGVDVPVLGAVILLRPTKSLALYLQMVGRALRPAPGKERALILDHAANSLRHGLYDFARDWSLEGKLRRPGEAPVRQCPECGAMMSLGSRQCPECGTVFERQGRTVEEDDIELVQVDPHALELRLMTYRQAIAWAGRDRTKLRRVQIARGYRPGWVHYQLVEAGQNARA